MTRREIVLIVAMVSCRSSAVESDLASDATNDLPDEVLTSVEAQGESEASDASSHDDGTPDDAPGNDNVVYETMDAEDAIVPIDGSYGPVNNFCCCLSDTLLLCPEWMGSIWEMPFPKEVPEGCFWNEDLIHYWLTPSGWWNLPLNMMNDPSGIAPRACIGPCAPDCGSAVCGSDGCSGTCGTCPEGTRCDGGMCVACAAVCGGHDCGDDGCGGTCGVCGGGRLCVSGKCQDAPCAPDCGEMITVPAGPFVMGGPTYLCGAFEAPEYCGDTRHIVDVPSFQIDRTPVTNAQYSRCLDAGICFDPGDCFHCNENCNKYIGGQNCGPDNASYPVFAVLFWDAYKYCRWAGKRMCSEAEWEKAARGTDGRLFPWGNDPPTCFDHLLFSGCLGPTLYPVGTNPKDESPYGVMDMLGNGEEFVWDDWHDTFEGAPTDGSAWLDGAPSDIFFNKRVIRGLGGGTCAGHGDGGSCWPDGIGVVHAWAVTFRDYLQDNEETGFRCCADAPQGPSRPRTPTNRSTSESAKQR
jgi:formylglycine-generating enzyme required for sulfatase activity